MSEDGGGANTVGKNVRYHLISILDNFCEEKQNLIVKKYSRKEKTKYI